MKRRNCSQVKYFVFGILLVILVLFQMEELFLYRDSGMVNQIFYKGPTLYIRLSDGRVYQAEACKAQINQGNWVKFTAIDHPSQEQDPFTPIMIRCKIKGWVLGTPLPN